MLDLFLWLDGSATRYWTVAWISFGLWFLGSVCPHDATHRWRRWNPPVVHAGLTLLMLLAFRWPGLGRNSQLDNPDESQLLAGALTVAHYGQYWGMVDCATAGPMDVLPLLLPKLVDLPVDYTTGRCVGLLLLWGATVFAWLAVRQVAGDQPGRLLLMPMACCLGFSHSPDFVQYSTEQAPIFYSALAIWLAIGAFSTAPLGRVRLALAGGVLALLPFAKLQAIPFTVCVGFCALVGILRRDGSPLRARLAAVGWLIGGGVLALGLMAVSVVRGAGLAEFYQSFWQSNLNYAQTRAYPWREFGSRLGALSHLVSGFDFYLVPALALVALGVAAWRGLSPAARQPALFGACLFLTGFVVVVAPGREFQHYLQFLILPTALFIGLLYGGLIAGAGRAWVRHSWLAIVLLAGVVPQVYYRTHDGNPYQGYLRDAREQAVGAVARHILRFVRPGDTMTVWAWMPTFHVQTQLPQGTRDAHAERQMSPNPLQSYFRHRYFTELETNRPAIFVDATGEENFGYHNREADGHERIPWLAEFVRHNYVLSADLETSRIYVRQDRWLALQPHP
ncbi:MAG: hypothetical protein JWQ62_291 [Lacunisphaera sp.]|nr:hypothetical protein [Lacunisphaera sp.]